MSRQEQGTAWRVLASLVLLLFVETALRLLLEPWTFPGIGSALADLSLRAGRLLFLGALLLLAAGAAGLLARRLLPRLATPAAELPRGVLRSLCAPGRALRLLVIFAAGTVACTLTVARGYDLAWRAGAVFASLLVVAAAGGELLWLRLRPPHHDHPAASGAAPSTVGRLLWSGMLGLLLFAVFPRIQRFQLPTAAVALAMVVVVPVPALPRGRLRGGLLALLAVIPGLCGLGIEAYRPALRRFVSVYTPVSGLGFELLRRLSDLDGDGSSGLFGLDCDDLDPRIYPGADDLPDDGVDQNCTGRDASLRRARRRFARGGVREPSPPSAAMNPSPDLFLVTVDALRYDAVFPARGAPLMPRTAAWARGCIRFSKARCNANFTDLSLLALLTGTHARHSRMGHNLKAAPGDEARGRLSVPPTLASALRVRGYHTEAVAPLHPMRPYLRFGFAEVRTPGPSNAHAPPAAEVLALASRRITARPGGSGRVPLLLWTHLLDTHAPYDGGDTRADYDRAARQMDAPLASYLGALPPDALVVLTADHGESFGEHGAFTHGNTLFEEELRVPLVLCAPERAGLGPPREVPAPVGLIDLTPTLLDLLGARAPYPRHGESLVPLLRTGAALRSPWLLAEVWIPYSHKQSIISGRWKWIRDLDLGWEALFDLERDPSERIDRSADEPAARERLRALFFEILDDDLDSFRSWRMGR